MRAAFSSTLNSMTKPGREPERRPSGAIRLPDTRPHRNEVPVERPDCRLQFACHSRQQSVYQSNGVVGVLSQANGRVQIVVRFGINRQGARQHFAKPAAYLPPGRRSTSVWASHRTGKPRLWPSSVSWSWPEGSASAYSRPVSASTTFLFCLPDNGRARH